MQQGSLRVLIKTVIETFEHLHSIDIAIGLNYRPQDYRPFDLLAHKVGRVGGIHFLDSHWSCKLTDLRTGRIELSKT